MPCHFALLMLTCSLYLGLSQAANSSVGDLTASHPPATQSYASQLPASGQTAASWIAQAPSDSASILKPGSRGEPVKALQTRLQELGYYSGAIDGQYGQSTQDAVKAFQQAVGLGVDGRVGVETQRRLQQAQSAQAQSPQAASPAAESSPEPSESPSNASTEPSSDSNAAPNAARQTNWQPWLLTGLGALAGVGLLCYWLTRSPHRSARLNLADERSLDPQTNNQPDAGSASPATPHVPGDDRNGHTALPLVLSESQTDEAASSTSAVQETTRLPKINIGEELLKDLHSPDPMQRRKAIWELGQRGDSQAIQPLVDLMMDSDSHQRSLILAAISEIGVRAMKPMNRALLISLQDESSDVRKNAIRDLTRVYDMVAQVSQLLGHAVNDPDVEVQETAQWALNQLNRIRTVAGVDSAPLLTNATNSPDYLPGDKST